MLGSKETSCTVILYEVLHPLVCIANVRHKSDVRQKSVQFHLVHAAHSLPRQPRSRASRRLTDRWAMTREMCPAFLADYPGNARARLSILYVVFTLSNSEMPMREKRGCARQSIHSFKVSQIGDLPAVASKGEGSG